jgi:hypothetical protein
MQETRIFVFVSEHASLGAFFSQRALENEHQAIVRCTEARARIIALNLKTKRGIEDLKLKVRTVHDAPVEAPAC